MSQDNKIYYFKHDDTKPLMGNSVQKCLIDKFLRKFIEKFKWPSYFPDLNPSQFILWGYFRDKVYNPMPITLDN